MRDQGSAARPPNYDSVTDFEAPSIINTAVGVQQDRHPREQRGIARMS
jgi:hypothetical protein